MLPWRLEEIKFGQQYKTAIAVSTATHIVIFLITILIGQLSIWAFNSKVLEIIKTDPIDVELVNMIPDRVEPAALIEKQQPIFVNPIPLESNVSDALPIIKEPEALPIERTMPENIAVVQKYEQLLSKHFASVLPKLPKDLLLPEKIYLWVKIDKSGNIYDYGFKPTPKDPKTLNFLDAAVSQATPVPTPPATDFINLYTQYLIPLNFR